MAKKDIYYFPLKHSTSSKILSFSAEAMAEDLKSNASFLWHLLQQLLQAHKRQCNCCNMVRRKVEELKVELEGATQPESDSLVHESDSEMDFNDTDTEDDPLPIADPNSKLLKRK